MHNTTQKQRNALLDFSAKLTAAAVIMNDDSNIGSVFTKVGLNPDLMTAIWPYIMKTDHKTIPTISANKNAETDPNVRLLHDLAHGNTDEEAAIDTDRAACIERLKNCIAALPNAVEYVCLYFDYHEKWPTDYPSDAPVPTDIDNPTKYARLAVKNLSNTQRTQYIFFGKSNLDRYFSYDTANLLRNYHIYTCQDLLDKDTRRFKMPEATLDQINEILHYMNLTMRTKPISPQYIEIPGEDIPTHIHNPNEDLYNPEPDTDWKNGDICFVYAPNARAIRLCVVDDTVMVADEWCCSIQTIDTAESNRYSAKQTELFRTKESILAAFFTNTETTKNK